MDMILSFLGGIVGSWIFLFAVFFFAIIFERSDRFGWSVFLGILTIASASLLLGTSVLVDVNWWLVGIGYAVVGFIHSVWRWFRWTTIITQNFNREVAQYGTASDYMLKDYNTALDYKQNLDRITYWILSWPISGAAYMIGDIVVVVQSIITRYMSNIFNRISQHAKTKANIPVAKIEE